MKLSLSRSTALSAAALAGIACLGMAQPAAASGTNGSSPPLAVTLVIGWPSYPSTNMCSTGAFTLSANFSNGATIPVEASPAGAYSYATAEAIGQAWYNVNYIAQDIINTITAQGGKCNLVVCQNWPNSPGPYVVNSQIALNMAPVTQVCPQYLGNGSSSGSGNTNPACNSLPNLYNGNTNTCEGPGTQQFNNVENACGLTEAQQAYHSCCSSHTGAAGCAP